jgi:hypothetical protein
MAEQSLLQRIEDQERELEQLLSRQQQIAQAVGRVQSWVDRVEGELDDLAVMYREELLFGIGEPKWKRRLQKAREYLPEPRYLESGRS